MEAVKKCINCQTTIYGRQDKKFCSDSCRNSHNNELNKDINNLMRNINHALKKNRRILVELNPHGKSKVHGEKLKGLGFDFKLHTSTYTTKKGHTYYFCYEQGYLQLENNMYALVVRQEYQEAAATED